MKVLKQGLSFEDAGRAMDAGGYVRQAIWHFRKGGDTFSTALAKMGGVLVVCVGPGRALHEWAPTMPEVCSSEWELVEF